jgi:hypothetical protein
MLAAFLSSALSFFSADLFLQWQYSPNSSAKPPTCIGRCANPAMAHDCAALRALTEQTMMMISLLVASSHAGWAAMSHSPLRL